MKENSKTAGSASTRRKAAVVPLHAASSPAKRQAAAILEVLAGVLRPAEAAELLETSLPRYYLWEKRALVGLLAACEPAPRGPRVDASRQMAALERENRRLQRECDRQQALVRAAERALGLARLSLVKTSAKPKEESQGSNGKRRRRVRPPKPEPTVLPEEVQALRQRVRQLEARAAAVEVQAELARTLPHVMGRARAGKKTTAGRGRRADRVSPRAGGKPPLCR
jgi:hypothetical protein